MLPLPVIKSGNEGFFNPIGRGNEASDQSVSHIGLRGQCGPSFSSQNAVLGGRLGDWMQARGGGGENWSLAEDKWAF